MTRTVSATITAAIAQDVTRPIYLIYMGWDAASPSYQRAATWGSSISWDGHLWPASGLSVSNLDANGGTLEMPIGDSDPWLALVMGEIPRNREIEIYEHQTKYTASPVTSDAVLIFAGYMDEAVITNSIKVSLIESSTRKMFPAGAIDRPTYTHLMPKGFRLKWGYDRVTVN